MHTILGLRAGLLALVVAWALQAGTAQAQLVDNPQNLLKAWAEAYATRGGEAMTKVYTKDAQVWGMTAKEPANGIDSIKQFYERSGQNVTERTATLGKVQMLPRKRVTMISGTIELKAKLKDGTARNTPARFTMTIIRESRRQWAILSHHISAMPN